MNRVVFQISALGRNDEPVPLVGLAEPVDPQRYEEVFTCPALAQSAPAADAEALYGKLLYEALSVNTVVRDHLTGARTSTERRFGVCAELLPQSRTDSLAWETLRFPDDDGQQYLALSTKYAFARVVTSGQPRVPVYQLTPPLRVVAVLSCGGVPADRELAELRAAAVDSAGTPRMSLLVVLGEAQLAERLQAEVDAGQAPEIAGVHLVPPDYHDLQGLVRGFRPHVLHLFCHGSSDGTVRLALRQDWLASEPGPGLVLDKEQVAELTRNTDGGFWMVVLNCCAGAASPDDDGLTSLARELVSKGSTHAVIGMRTPIRSELARHLTRCLYGSLFDELGPRTAAPDGSTAALDWACVVATARNRLYTTPELNSTAAPGQEREWTVPALYLRKEDFLLQVVAPGQGADDARALRLELTALLSVRASLPPGGADKAFREALVARVHEIAATLGIDPADLEDSP
ncbi:CHAT domain-containing protein [Isoptericola jiangsuensis]|uniref:CHAT domain-containing protein n=1 Tax=Isoptericola jiangsuensis TaxID=548579 RepID=A0A2A9EY25_9MICO|nr:CHAT domain-containing protein [Isoptericola jiangsuensis]PFG43150.1 CHAT domain-containing protein [Isoptericola jiangsuensis]